MGLTVEMTLGFSESDFLGCLFVLPMFICVDEFGELGASSGHTVGKPPHSELQPKAEMSGIY